MKQWWQNLQKGEQRLILRGSIVLGIVMLWVFAVLPFQQTKRTLQDRINARGQQLIEITQIAAQARVINKPGQAPDRVASRGNRSLLRITDESARAAGLAAALKRIEPDSDKQVQVRLENADFDKLISWLELIEGKYAVTVESSSINKSPASASGAVNAHLSLIDND